MKDSHPLIAFSFFVAAICLTMCASHPLLAILSLLVAIIFQVVIKGIIAGFRQLAFAILIVIIVTLFNGLFVRQGLTVMFFFMKNPITKEAVQYGFTLGCMLAAVLMWFYSYSEMVGSDRFLALFSWIAPVSTMMVSMIFNYIPQIMQKSQQINDTHKAFAYVDNSSAGLLKSEDDSSDLDIDDPTCRCTADDPEYDTEALLAYDPTLKRTPIIEKLRWPVRLSSILMGWSMETGLATAASMRARAYGSTRRSSYLPLFWTLRDGVLLSVFAALFVTAIVSEFTILSGFLFYPRMSALTISWFYIPFVLFMISPLIYEGGIRLKWRLSKF
ncbi:MAG: energy-coupling factor transporter transmembrane protein EcfT [Coriobacteriia bacterium]|nr:energy-coupling factor transporter transmembrane protein EcfT [Coriobacteriia bacterium]